MRRALNTTVPSVPPACAEAVVLCAPALRPQCSVPARRVRFTSVDIRGRAPSRHMDGPAVAVAAAGAQACPEEAASPIPVPWPDPHRAERDRRLQRQHEAREMAAAQQQEHLRALTTALAEEEAMAREKLLWRSGKVQVWLVCPK